MMFEIKQGEMISEENFDELLELDRKTYGDEIFTTRGMAKERFEKFKEGIIAVYIDDELAGFTCFYNVEAEIYREALQQKIFDDNLNAQNVIPLAKETKNYILLMDMNIAEDFRKMGLAKVLNNKISQYLRKKHLQGFMMGGIFAYAMTPKGLKILSNLGGKVIWEKEELTLVDIDLSTFLRISI